jgi:bifunctional non-homologous end joining protein LigD
LQSAGTRKLLFAGKVRQEFSRSSHFGEGITTEEMNELCWLKPKLVAQISFTEWTNYGLLRHAIFEGHKEPRSVVREVPAR